MASRPPAPAPPLELLRTLWTMHRPPNRTVTAAIYAVETGHELRVHYGADVDNVLDSLLSRGADDPLVARATELRTILEGQGWRPSAETDCS